MGPKIGWFHVNIEGTAAFPSPEKVHLSKDPSTTKRGFLSCPAVRASAAGYFAVKSPFSLHMRFRRTKDVVSFIPVYPFTTVNEAKLEAMFRLEPREIWRSIDIPLVQMPSPYCFVADEPIEIEQCPPIFAETTSLNWRLISGKFDIYGWQRPLNWAFEWDSKCGDLMIKLGEPLYYVRFYDKSGSLIPNPDLLQISLTEELRTRLNASSGVTALQRGTAALIKKSAEERSKSLISEVKK